MSSVTCAICNNSSSNEGNLVHLPCVCTSVLVHDGECLDRWLENCLTGSGWETYPNGQKSLMCQHCKYHFIASTQVRLAIPNNISGFSQALLEALVIIFIGPALLVWMCCAMLELGDSTPISLFCSFRIVLSLDWGWTESLLWFMLWWTKKPALLYYFPKDAVQYLSIALNGVLVFYLCVFRQKKRRKLSNKLSKLAFMHEKIIPDNKNVITY